VCLVFSDEYGTMQPMNRQNWLVKGHGGSSDCEAKQTDFKNLKKRSEGWPKLTKSLPPFRV
jgi:hypothetical protein